MMPSINIRIPRSDKEWLKKTAAAAGQSLSGFLRTAAIKEAHKILGPPKIVRPVVRVKMGRASVGREREPS